MCENEEEIMKILQSYFTYNNMANYQLSSFNEFITHGIRNIIEDEIKFHKFENNRKEYKLDFINVHIDNPQIIEENRNIHLLYPSEARRRELNYESTVYCDIIEMYSDADEHINNTHHRVPICKIPIMVGSKLCNLHKLSSSERVNSGECPNDPGGYFIIKGNERVIVAQIRHLYNKVLVFKQKDKKDKKDKYTAEVRSMSEQTNHSVKISCHMNVDERHITFSIPYVKKEIAVGILFRAMGFSESEFIDLINLKHIPQTSMYVANMVRDFNLIYNQDNAIEYISNHVTMINQSEEDLKKYTLQILNTEILPHMSITSTMQDKAIFLGDMVNKLLLTSVNLRAPDNRDSYINKRIENTGILIHDLFKILFKRYINDIETKLIDKKHRPDIISTMTNYCKNITKGMLSAFSTGNWGVQKNSYIRTGVSQVLDRSTFLSVLSHLRRMMIPISKEGKNTEIRMIDSSQFGFVCPAETPEGHSAGINLNTAIAVSITKKSPYIFVKELIEECKELILLSNVTLSMLESHTLVFLNGVILGLTQDSDAVLEYVKTLRRYERIDKEVSISYDPIDNNIRIYCDEGRPIRPFFTMTNNEMNIDFTKQDYDWNSLLSKNLICYLDPSEIENSTIAMFPEDVKIQYNDYCEIHPSCILGVIASTIPFPDHSQSPRNCYYSNMGKQSQGVSTLAYRIRYDTKLCMLNYLQSPLVSTKMSEFIGINEMPSGMNVIVAISTCDGFNQEDSIVFNRASVDRGLFTSTLYETITEKEKKSENYVTEKICIPPENNETVKNTDSKYFKRKYANYSKLDSNGIIRVNCLINKGDVLVGKIKIVSPKNTTDTITDISRVARVDEEGIVDRVSVDINPQGHKYIKIVIRNEKIPMIGDKFASREAQKGTVGAIFAPENMPFSINTGIIPDMIINPHCIPSRMTINQLMECVLGKIGALSGEIQDASPFTNSSYNISESICTKLAQYGFERHGWETLCSGITGEIIESNIFIGPIYYQRLKHMVSSKMHARVRGPVTRLTRQPLEGRSRDGGLRFGEMERDCMIAHGTSAFLKERLCEVSDNYNILVCTDCKSITIPDKCHICGKNNIVKTVFPYATKLLVQELNAMTIKVDITPT